MSHPRHSTPRLAALLALLALLVLTGSALAADPPFALEPAAGVELTWEAVRKEAAVVRLFNNTDQPLTLDITLVGFEDNAAVLTYLAVTPSGTVDLGRAPLALALQATVPAGQDDLDPGTYTGYLVVAGAGTALNLPLTVHAGDAAPVAAGAVKPLFAAWTVTAVCPLPWDCTRPALRHAVLPLDAASGAAAEVTVAGARPLTLGYLTRSGGGSATVDWLSGPLQHPELSDKLGVELGITPHAGAGTYSGTIDFQPDDDKAGAVALTVNATDHILWFLLTIGLGVVGTWTVTRWQNVNRPIRRLYLDLLKQMGQEGQQQAVAAFAKAAGGAVAPDSFDFTTDFDNQRKALVEQISALDDRFGGSSVTLDETNDAYKAATTRLAALKDHLATWEPFGSDLKAVRDAAGADALRQARDRLQAALPAAGDAPGHTATLAALTAGGRFSVDPGADSVQLSAGRSAVQGLTGFLSAWPGWVERVLAAENGLQKPDPATAPAIVQQWYHQARLDLCTVKQFLWQAPDRAWLDERGAIATLLRAEALVAGLRCFDADPLLSTLEALRERLESITDPRAAAELFGRLPSLDLPPGDGLEGMGGAARDWLLQLLPPVQPTPVQAEARRRVQLQRALILGDGAVLLVSLAIGLAGGLATLYLGKQFGGWVSYIGALGWGFGPVTVLQVLGSGINRLLGVVDA